MALVATKVGELGARARVLLTGALDEAADLESIGRMLHPSREILIDFSGVRRVNSMGITKWLPFFARLVAERDVEIEAISYVLVQQANSIENFFAHRSPKSCCAPYYCMKCRSQIDVVVLAEELSGTEGEAPEKRCNRCGEALTFDELENYFACMKVAR